MYEGSRWRGYGEMFNLYAVQEAGQEFGILIGIKRQVYGSDGYTNFLPPDSAYDPARVAMHLRDAPEYVPPGARDGDPATWRYPAIDRLAEELTALPETTRKILFFVPYNQQPDAAVRISRVVRCGANANCAWRRWRGSVPNALAIDFMLPSPITGVDDNYWDGVHYRIGIADRIAHDLAAAESRRGIAGLPVAWWHRPCVSPAMSSPPTS